MKCYICEQDKETRPYGEGGQPICFQCMKASPEREAAAKQKFGRQLDACGPIAVLYTAPSAALSDAGPVTLTPDTYDNKGPVTVH
jgi:hypothetical protein